MLHLNIEPVCQAKGIKSVYTFLRRNDFTHSMAHRIATGKYRQPKLEHIEQLCLIFGCVPHDILEWEPEQGQPADVPLGILIPKTITSFNWMQEVQKLPVDQLREMTELMQEKLQSVKEK